MNTNFIHQYFYLWYAALAFPLWAFIVYKKKRSRVEVIYMGILFGTAALALDRYCFFYDYWRPPTLFDIFNFESFLCGFFLGGISAKSYELFFNKEYHTQESPNSLFILALVFGSVFYYMVLLGLFHLNSVDIMVCIGLTWVIVFLLIDPSMFRMCVWSGVIMVGLSICLYTIVLAMYPSAIQEIWLTNNLKGVFIFNVPIEKYYFFFAFGCIGSVMYKVASGTIKKRSCLTLSKRFEARSFESNRPNSKYSVWKSESYLTDLLVLLKPFYVPLLLLLLVIGRMVIFGDDRIPVGQFFNLFR